MARPPHHSSSPREPESERPCPDDQPRKPRVVLCVSGSIAAYKAIVLLRSLLQSGLEVRVVMTRSALEFVGAATFAALSGHRVEIEMFDSKGSGESHVSLSSAADLVVVAPATADVLARMAAGRADDLVTAILLCTKRPILIAPAMHPSMWSHPATQRNVELLRTQPNLHLVGPVVGEVASGDQGLGRMEEPEAICERALALLEKKGLDNQRIVVSAGPTLEDIDPVRYIGNRSSGKMGFALAKRAAARGATTTLVTGPVLLPTPAGVNRIDVRNAREMQAALEQVLGKGLDGCDALIMAAAVGDYRPSTTHDSKLHRSTGEMTLTLVPNPDILKAFGVRRHGQRPILVGFCVETGNDSEVLERSHQKLLAKNVDIIVGNRADEAFGRDDNRACLVSRDSRTMFGTLSKPCLADRILDRVEEILKGQA